MSAYKNETTFDPEWYVGKFDGASWQSLARLGLTRTRAATGKEE